MEALTAGAVAPEFSLPNTAGSEFSLKKTRKSKPVVAVFFKVSCPTCQYAFPYFERIYRAYPAEKVSFVGISQGGKDETMAFAKSYGVSFPLLLEDSAETGVSKSYGIANVPTTFMISSAGTLEFSSVSWVRAEIEELNQQVAAAAGVPTAPIFKPGEEIVGFKAG